MGVVSGGAAAGVHRAQLDRLRAGALGPVMNTTHETFHGLLLRYRGRTRLIQRHLAARAPPTQHPRPVPHSDSLQLPSLRSWSASPASCRFLMSAPASARLRALSASALDLPFDAGSFDAVLLQHVAINIADRARLYHGIRRVLKPGGKFGTFDVLIDGEPHYPLPWAKTPATSFLLTAAATREAVELAGFRTLALARRYGGRQGLGHPIARVGPAAFAQSWRRDAARLRKLYHQSGTQSHEGRLGIVTAVFDPG